MQLIRKKFDDFDQLCDSLTAWDLEMYPLSSIRPAEIGGSFVQAIAEDCLYGFAGFRNPLKMFGTAPKGLVTFNVMEASQRQYWWRGHNLNSEMVWIFPIGGELHSISAPGFRVHTLSVTEERVAGIAAECGIDLPPPSKRPEVFSAPGKAVESIRSHLRGMRDGVLPFSDENVDQVLPLLLSTWLKPGVWGERQRPTVRARDRAVCKSLEIMDKCDLSTLTVEVLLEECGVSKRSLQYAFRERFNTSPAALIKSLRLAATKAALRRTDSGQKTVADIGAEFGFWHPSQFAADYRKAFGERPSETLRKTY
jgi:AraC family ethanolamine operon transcriptional activator